MYTIRKIKPSEVEEALALAWEVFKQFEEPDYSPEGAETFRRDIIDNITFREKCAAGECPIYAAFDGDKIVGIMGMRSSKTHIKKNIITRELPLRFFSICWQTG